MEMVSILPQEFRKSQSWVTCVSSAVMEQLASDTNYQFNDLGYRDFKNIKRPIHVYRLRLGDLLVTHPMLNLESRV
jgi:hypothetical protein